MRILLMLFSVLTFTMHGFTEKLFGRFILGADMLADVQRVCATTKNSQEYDALYTKLLNMPVPLYVRWLDRIYGLLGKSQDARLATMWYETGAALNDVLYSLILTNLGMAVWYDDTVQAKLQTLYAQDDVLRFNQLMEKLKALHQQVDLKIKTPGSWWPTHKYTLFKDSQGELASVLEQTLGSLVDLRLLINKLNPEPANSVFKNLVPSIIRVITTLQALYQSLEFIQVTPVNRWYGNLRIKVLTEHIKYCIPPLTPLSAQR